MDAGNHLQRQQPLLPAPHARGVSRGGGQLQRLHVSRLGPVLGFEGIMILDIDDIDIEVIPVIFISFHRMGKINELGK